MNELLLLPIAIWLISIDIFITLITFKWIKALIKFVSPPKMRSVPVGDDPSHRVDPRFKAKLATTPREGVATLYDLANEAFKRYGSRHCMGTRKYLGWKVPNKVKNFGEGTIWRSFADVDIEAHKFGAALRKVGMVSAPKTTNLEKVSTKCRMAIFENTCAEWLIAAVGAFTQSITVTTVYATLGIDAVAEAVNDNIIPVMVCNKKDVVRLVNMIKKMPTLKYIIYTNDLIAPDDIVDLPAAPKGVTIISFQDFVAMGDVAAFPPTPPTPETCAVVMYTSGSTGKPKGVIINHAQVVAVTAAADVAFQIQPGKDVYLAYLPLAHIMEMMAEFVLLGMGCTMCYADPKSLSTTGAYPTGALEHYSPTLMVAVPKIWDVIKKGVVAKVELKSPVAQWLVKIAMQWRSFCLSNGFDSPLFKKLIFDKMTAAVGGKLTKAISGGGPLNSEVQEYVRTAFGIQLVQGYGLTETCAGGTVQDLDDYRVGIAGAPIASVEIKLESCPDVNDKGGQPYLSKDRFDVDGNPVFGRGEILIKGGNISCGYYMEPDKTKEVFESDGWFHTGDIGQFMSDGSVRIVDRKKNLVKLKGGEYVALEKMEMTYGNCTFVDAIAGGICCFGDGDMDRPVAMMQLSEPATMKWAKANGVDGDFETVKKSKALYDAIMQDMKKEHSKSDLSHLEKLVGVALLNNPWTPENGCLTAANKLQRRAVEQQFDKEYQELKKKGVF